jgi:hypothetical protein
MLGTLVSADVGGECDCVDYIAGPNVRVKRDLIFIVNQTHHFQLEVGL